ncbi:MAG: putative MFS family arabinose efflux permease [Oceanospirillaceae bacterium]|jgi:predicted MFS family arabinose efflux permease
MQSKLSRAQVYLAGICSLIVTVGVARFSYTSLLPIMQEQAGISESVGGWLATSNYLGYMAGVLLASNLNNLNYKFILYRSYLIFGVLSTAGMMLTTDIIIWSLLRFVAGVCASAGLILASGLILKWLVHNKHRPELGIHFSGIGVSIMFAALLVELLTFYGVNWQYQWLTFAALALLFSIPAWQWMPHPDLNKKSQHSTVIKDNPPSKQFTLLLLAAYFCAGYGYVVSATFIVDIVEGLAALKGKGQLIFVIVGLAAIPAVIVWDLIARRIGFLKSLFFAYCLQIVGIVLPSLSDHLAVIMLSAVLFGGTFVACVSLVLTMAGQFYPSNPAKFMGKMTLAYGVSQIVAPICTGILAEHYGNYNIGLYLSGAVMLLGSIILVVLINYQKRSNYVGNL